MSTRFGIFWLMILSLLVGAAAVVVSINVIPGALDALTWHAHEESAPALSPEYKEPPTAPSPSDAPPPHKHGL